MTFVPRRVVLSSTGSFATSIVLHGQAPLAQFAITEPTDLQCGHGIAAFSLQLDPYGNGMVSVFGGPDFGGSPPCAPGRHRYTVVVGSISFHLTLTLTAPRP